MILLVITKTGIAFPLSIPNLEFMKVSEFKDLEWIEGRHANNGDAILIRGTDVVALQITTTGAIDRKVILPGRMN